MGEQTIEQLQERWNYLYKEYLPALAKSKDEAQDTWPVSLDHCFARIVLDNAVGKDKPWTEVVKSPAYKNMTGAQIQDAIALAEQLANGQANLVEMDERSLKLRGKQSKKRKANGGGDSSTRGKQEVQRKKKKQTNDPTVSSYFLPSPRSPIKEESKAEAPESELTMPATGKTEREVDMGVQVKRIQNSDITDFRKLTLQMLCQIPRGRYSTYGAMSDHISATSHKTCARAVGNAMRNNPFAPEVPCHRILAGDGTLGGFKGHWGEQGQFASDKHKLLYEEGVRFDSSGKVKGPPFRDFI